MKRLIVKSIKFINTMMDIIFTLVGFACFFCLFAIILIHIIGLDINFYVAGILGWIGFIIIISLGCNAMSMFEKLEKKFKTFMKQSEEEKDEEA